MDKLNTHYDNLKVIRNAPVEVIRAAYRAMAQKYHPDINSSPAANNTMKLLNEAWEVLSDPLKRAEHDKWILEEEEKQKKQSSFNSKNLKEQASPFVVLNTWLGRKDIQIKVIAVVVAVFSGGLLWLSIENHRAKKVIEEINALAATSVIEKPSDWQVVEQKPLRFVPLSELPEKITNKKEKGKDFSNLLFDTPVQSESKKAEDSERQEISGYVKGAYRQASDGLSNFTVDNQQGGGDAIARIYLNGAKPASRSIYVKVGEKFTARRLPPGSYVFRYRFIGSTKTYEADRLFPLEETTTSEGTRFSNVTVTLFRVSDGNLQTKDVPEEKF